MSHTELGHTEKKQVALYARVSTFDQEPENQLADLRRYVQARGWSAVEFVDKGFSGSKERRPALDSLVADGALNYVGRIEVVPLEELEAGAPGRVDEIAPIAEIADTAYVPIVHVPLEHRLGVGAGEMAFGDDAMRIAGAIGEGLQPFGLVDRIGRAERGLDVDCLWHVREADLGDVVLDPVVLRLERVDIAEEAVHGIGLEPGIAELRPLQVVQVKVRVDERDVSHGSVPSRRKIVAGCRHSTARVSAIVGCIDDRTATKNIVSIHSGAELTAQAFARGRKGR